MDHLDINMYTLQHKEQVPTITNPGIIKEPDRNTKSQKKKKYIKKN